MCKLAIQYTYTFHNIALNLILGVSHVGVAQSARLEFCHNVIRKEQKHLWNRMGASSTTLEAPPILRKVLHGWNKYLRQ